MVTWYRKIIKCGLALTEDALLKVLGHAVSLGALLTSLLEMWLCMAVQIIANDLNF